MDEFDILGLVSDLCMKNRDAFVQVVAYEDFGFFFSKAMHVSSFGGFVALRGKLIEKRLEKIKSITDENKKNLTSFQNWWCDIYKIFIIKQLDFFKIFFTFKSLERFRPIFELTNPRLEKLRKADSLRKNQPLHARDYLSFSEFLHYKLLDEVFYYIAGYLDCFSRNSWKVIENSLFCLIHPLIFPKSYKDMIAKRNRILQSIEDFCIDNPLLEKLFNEFKNFLKTAEEEVLILNQFREEVKEKREELEREVLLGTTIKEFFINQKKRR